MSCDYNLRSWLICFSAFKLLIVACRLEKAADYLPGATTCALCLPAGKAILFLARHLVYTVNIQNK